MLRERFSGPREAIDGYVRTGLAVRWSFSDDVALHGRIDNLFDTDYQTAFDRPGIPFSVALGLRIAG